MAAKLESLNYNLTKEGRLDHRIIGVFAQDTIPDDTLTVGSVVKEGHPCVARALYLMSIDDRISGVYVNGEPSKECCWGVLSWFGYAPFPPNVEDLFSTDSPNPDSMRIKSSSDMCRRTFRDMGKMTPLGRNIIMRPLSKVGDMDPVRSIICFGDAGQIRDLCAMVHFGESRVYSPITSPWGSGCATFVAFPSGMADRAPRDTAFLGPMTPEAEGWLPKNILALSMPIEVAIRMAEGYEASFASRR